MSSALPLAFAEMQNHQELHYTVCIKMCSFGDSCKMFELMVSACVVLLMIFFFLLIFKVIHIEESCCGTKRDVNPNYLCVCVLRSYSYVSAGVRSGQSISDKTAFPLGSLSIGIIFFLGD